MANTPKAVGKNVAVTLGVITINASTGAITVGTAAAMTGICRSFSVSMERRNAEVLALDQTMTDNVEVGQAFTIEIEGYRRHTAAGGAVASTKFIAGTYLQVVASGIGGISGSSTYTFDCMVTRCDIAIDDQGPVIERLSLVNIDNGGANPALT